MEILKEWIAGRGRQLVTWNTLIEVLHGIELSTPVRETEAANPPEGDEDRSTKVTQDSNQRTVSKVCAEDLVTDDSDQRDNGEIHTGSRLQT